MASSTTYCTPAVLPCLPPSLSVSPTPSVSRCFGVNTVECAPRAWKASSVALLACGPCIFSLYALSKSKSTVAPSVCGDRDREREGRSGVEWSEGEGIPQGHRLLRLDRCWCPKMEWHDKDCPAELQRWAFCVKGSTVCVKIDFYWCSSLPRAGQTDGHSARVHSLAFLQTVIAKIQVLLDFYGVT